MSDVKAQIQSLTTLAYGWDGYNGKPVSLETAAYASKVFDVIYCAQTPQPFIVPGTSGDLQIEWHTDVVDIELHILAPNDLEAWICSPETLPCGEEFHVSMDLSKIVMLMQHIFTVCHAYKSQGERRSG